jgi:preprotein translocase subunit YajC
VNWTNLPLVTLLAQADGGDGPAPGGDGETMLMRFLASPLSLIAAFFLLFYFLLLRPQQRERARRQSMLAAVKKNDRVVTAGGIYGVVTNVHREADEVTIKVDEATNTKIRVTFNSISQVLGEPVSDADAPRKES